MSGSTFKKPLLLVGLILALWLGITYLLPLLLPFLLGGILALTAEPAVSFSQRRLKLPRGLAAGVGVTVTLILILGLLSMLGALLVKELSRLSAFVPVLERTAKQGIGLLEDFLISAAQRAPESAQPMLTQTVLNFFDDGSLIVEQASQKVLSTVSAVLGWVPDGALSIGTGLLSGFMISARLPRIRRAICTKLPPHWQEQYLPALGRMRAALLGWLRAQLKLMTVTFLILLTGFLILGISYAPLWAMLIALVDAVPLLGTGTVLAPWALICFLQGNMLRGTGLLCIYAGAMVTRTVLEPRLVGRQLGIDPLLTLVAIYLGYRLWGFVGLLAVPVLTAAIVSTVAPARSDT